MKETSVWDIAVRLFHWSLVVFVAIALISGDDGEGLHVKAGYIVLGLVCFRVIWGFIGTKHARFTDFVRGPSEVFGYLKNFMSVKHRYYLGHNPAGGAMIVVLLITLSAVCLTGIKIHSLEDEESYALTDLISLASIAYADDHGDDDDDDERNHKRKGHIDNEAEELWEEVHEVFVGFLIAFVAIHIFAVLATWGFHRENLIKAMITGRKPLE